MSEYSKTTEAWRCDDCGADMVTPLFCDSCGTDYPERRGFSAFAILGLPVTYAQDDDAVEALELAIARRLHPDKWLGKGERLHKRALIAQSAVNEAFGAVSSPFRRASTLLELMEAPESPKPPQAFLIEQLELMEEIEDGVDAPRKKTLQKLIRGELRALKARLREAFLAAEAGNESALIDGRMALDRSRYWRNAKRALRGAAPE